METDPWGGPSIMVRGGIGLNSKLGPVVFQNLGPGRGNGVTAARYRDQVLTPHVVPHFNRHPNKTFQQDNARAHTARVTRDYLQQNNITVLDWPALNPDLNPFELYGTTFSWCLTDSSQDRQLLLNFLWRIRKCGLVFLWPLSIASLTPCTGDVWLWLMPMAVIHAINGSAVRTTGSCNIDIVCHFTGCVKLLDKC